MDKILKTAQFDYNIEILDEDDKNTKRFKAIS